MPEATPSASLASSFLIYPVFFELVVGALALAAPLCSECVLRSYAGHSLYLFKFPI